MNFQTNISMNILNILKMFIFLFNKDLSVDLWGFTLWDLEFVHGSDNQSCNGSKCNGCNGCNGCKHKCNGCKCDGCKFKCKGCKFKCNWCHGGLMFSQSHSYTAITGLKNLFWRHQHTCQAWATQNIPICINYSYHLFMHTAPPPTPLPYQNTFCFTIKNIFWNASLAWQRTSGPHMTCGLSQ